MSPHNASRFFYLHVRWAHTAQHFFSFLCIILSRESTERITIFLTSCHLSPTANRDFFSFFLCVQKISCFMSPHNASRFFYLHVRWAHTAQHFFSFFCVNLISRESTQRITIFLPSCQVSPHSATFFFFFVRKSHITRVHTAHHDFFNFMSDEPTQCNFFFSFFVRKSHITWVHTAHHDSSNLTLHALTKRLPIHKWPMGLEHTQHLVSDFNWPLQKYHNIP